MSNRLPLLDEVDGRRRWARRVHGCPVGNGNAEELIHDTVESLAGKRTIIVIGHRLSSVRRADRIIVLDRGRIVETGSPITLLRDGTRYKELFAAQLSPGRPAA
jgi:ABC-type transporter Mla maintaining outer membrane lipid asymmetry ATPase subunit MlaF